MTGREPANRESINAYIARTGWKSRDEVAWHEFPQPSLSVACRWKGCLAPAGTACRDGSGEPYTRRGKPACHRVRSGDACRAVLDRLSVHYMGGSDGAPCGYDGDGRRCSPVWSKVDCDRCAAAKPDVDWNSMGYDPDYAKIREAMEDHGIRVGQTWKDKLDPGRGRREFVVDAAGWSNTQLRPLVWCRVIGRGRGRKPRIAIRLDRFRSSCVLVADVAKEG